MQLSHAKVKEDENLNEPNAKLLLRTICPVFQRNKSLMNMNQSPPRSHGLLRAFYRSAATLCFDYAYVQPHPQVPFQS